jgi:hypothetical protein
MKGRAVSRACRCSPPASLPPRALFLDLDVFIAPDVYRCWDELRFANIEVAFDDIFDRF